jgi:hypothetical protein
MKASEFTTEDNFGTHPKRPARTGSRHPRGHQPVPRYKTITAQDSDNTAESVAEGSLDDIEDTKQFRDAVALAKTQKAIRQAKYGKDTKFYADGTPHTPQETARRAAERKAKKDKKGVAEGNQEEKIAGRYDPADFDSMIQRLSKVAKAGPMKTVWDPEKRVYRNMPTAQQPAQQPKKAPR